MLHYRYCEIRSVAPFLRSSPVGDDSVHDDSRARNSCLSKASLVRLGHRTDDVDEIGRRPYGDLFLLFLLWSTTSSSPLPISFHLWPVLSIWHFSLYRNPFSLNQQKAQQKKRKAWTELSVEDRLGFPSKCIPQLLSKHDENLMEKCVQSVSSRQNKYCLVATIASFSFSWPFHAFYHSVAVPRTYTQKIPDT